jgi:putative chitinase
MLQVITVLNGESCQVKFDRTKFWATYNAQFGHPPHDPEQSATNNLLSLIETDPQIERLEWAAYLLGTIRNECGSNMLPIKEIKAKPGTLIWNKYQSKYWNTGFMGRGYSQLTWEGNYRKFSRALYGDDRLVQNPDLVLSPEVGYKILATGCVKGMFTKYKLSDFLNGKTKDYLHARQVVNGITKEAYKWALRVADYCKRYEACLKSA